MASSPTAASYWCHMCSRSFRAAPQVDDEGLFCPVCGCGFVEEMEIDAPLLGRQAATFDIEAAAPETLASAGGGGSAPLDAEAKRMGKMVQTVCCLFAASASVLLFLNLPSSKPGAVLYSVDKAFICLGLFTSLDLSLFSIVVKHNLAVAKIQKHAMVMAVIFVVISFTLRVSMIPQASLRSVWWFVSVLLVGAVAAAVYLAVTWKLGSTQGAAAGTGTECTAEGA